MLQISRCNGRNLGDRCHLVDTRKLFQWRTLRVTVLRLAIQRLNKCIARSIHIHRGRLSTTGKTRTHITRNILRMYRNCLILP